MARLVSAFDLLALEKSASALALLALLALCATSPLPQLRTELESAELSRAEPSEGAAPPQAREHFIGAYTGAPYTYPSDVRFQRPDGSDFTIHGVEWDAKPFKDPIYYGARWARWSAMSSLGQMLDFTHSKVYSRREQQVSVSGLRGGEALAGSRKIGDIFHHFEFTHGHNMLTLNGLYRLPWRTSYFSPYVGIGAGASIPHSEVQFKGERGRTYEYQYTGPVLQILGGLEIRVPRISYFVEYKFTFAPYHAPLHLRDGTIVFADLWQQLMRWWSGREPDGGWLTTRLTSHQVISGMGYRTGSPSIAPSP